MGTPHHRHDNADRSVVAQRRSEAIALVNSGLTQRQVAEQLMDKYPFYRGAEGEPHQGHVAEDISRALAQQRAELNQNLEEMIQLGNLRLQGMRRIVYGVISRPHYVMYQGAFVVDEEGNKVRDDAPILQAIDRLTRIEERWAKLNGADAGQELKIALERRADLEATVVTEAILAGFDAIEMTPDARQRALEAAQARMATLEDEYVRDGD